MKSKAINNMNDSELAMEFLRLFLENQNRIYGFIFTLLPSRSEADDIMQDTTMVMWIKFSEFEVGTSFYAWATQIARFKIMNHRKKQKSGTRQFREDALAEILAFNDQMTSVMDERLIALEGCVEKLKQKDKNIIHLRYKKNIMIKDIALNVGRSVQGMYKTMARIHNLLEHCVSRALLK